MHRARQQRKGASQLFMKANLRGPSGLDRNRLPVSEGVAAKRNAARKSIASRTDVRPMFEKEALDPEVYDPIPLIRGSVDGMTCHILSFSNNEGSVSCLSQLEQPVTYFKESPEDYFEEKDVYYGEGSVAGAKQLAMARRRRQQRRKEANPELQEQPKLHFIDASGKEFIGDQRYSTQAGYRYFFVGPHADGNSYSVVPANSYYTLNPKPNVLSLTDKEVEEFMARSDSVTQIERRLQEKKQADREEQDALRQRMKLIVDYDELTTEKEEDEESKELLKPKKQRKDHSKLAQSIEGDGEDDIDNLPDDYEPPDEDGIYATPAQTLNNEKDIEEDDEDSEDNEEKKANEREIKISLGIETDDKPNQGEDEDEDSAEDQQNGGDDEDEDISSDFDPDKEDDYALFGFKDEVDAKPALQNRIAMDSVKSRPRKMKGEGNSKK
eukprot:gene2710-5588_t